MGAQVIQEPPGIRRACFDRLAKRKILMWSFSWTVTTADRSELPIILAPNHRGHADIKLGSRFAAKATPVRYRGTNHSQSLAAG